MPRYFFDLAIGKQRLHDHHGLELPDDETAREAALEEARDFLRHRSPTGTSLEDAVEVANIGGERLFRVPLSGLS